MIIPNSRSKCREIHLTQRTLFVSGFMVCLFLGFFAYLFFSNVNLKNEVESAMVDNELLETYKTKAERIDSLVVSINTMEEEVNKLTNLNNKLQTMVGVGGSDVSIGGSTRINDFEDAYLLDKSKLLTNLEIEIEDIFDEASKQADVSESLNSFFKEHTTMLSHLPTLRPVDGGWLSSYFGRRLDPFTKKPSFHNGIDISARTGTEIIAPADGIVTFASRKGSFGRMMKIDHGNGFKTYFGHLNGYNAKVGQKVSRGDVIAYLGRSGRTTGPHLHYEIRLHGKPVNPMKYIIEE